MLAIFQRDLRSYAVTMTGWVFVAAVLVLMGFFTMVYNLNYGYGNFEYVLSNLTIVFVIAVPVLTMRSFAEERRSRTDQLLYALPLSSTKIVLGKYLAMLAVLAVPCAVALVYPLILVPFGEVYLPTIYLCVFAFFLMGAAFIAVGMFVSSLTESQITSAVICLVVVLANYFLTTLTSYIPTDATTSVVLLTVLVAALAAGLAALTKNPVFGAGVGVILELALVVVCLVNAEALEGLVPNLLSGLSLFDRYTNFVSGILDLGSVACYLACALVFCALTVHVFESRRWN